MAEAIWQGQPSHNAIHRELEIEYSNAVHGYSDGRDFHRLTKVHIRLRHDTHAVWDTRFQINKNRQD